jgi:hypothetical protein
MQATAVESAAIIVAAMRADGWTKAKAERIAGTLGKPSKMPGRAYGLPAQACKVGGKLAAVPGSVCHECYALKGNYQYPSVQTAQQRRLAAIDHPQWEAALTYLIADAIAQGAEPFFRWHDSGDLQSVDHALRIIAFAERLPFVAFWLPTREQRVVRSIRECVPSNLIVRVSAQMVDGAPPAGFTHVSLVHTAAAPANAYACPAQSQGNACRDCRACWARDVATVSYHVH